MKWGTMDHPHVQNAHEPTSYLAHLDTYISIFPSVNHRPLRTLTYLLVPYALTHSLLQAVRESQECVMVH